MGIRAFIQYEILLPRLKRTGVLVVYDPEGRYRDLCQDLASETMTLVDASDNRMTSADRNF